MDVSTCLDADTTIPSAVAEKFGEILWSWRALGRFERPRCTQDLLHTLDKSHPYVQALADSDLRSFAFPTDTLRELIRALWMVLLSGLREKRPAGDVAITKAILLITRGRIGPAFDSNVQSETGTFYINNSEALISFLSSLAADLALFENRHSARIEDLVPFERGPVAVGRAMDMLLGPKDKH